MKKFKILAVVLVILFILIEVFIFNKTEIKREIKPIVAVSSFFLYDIIKHIAGKNVEIVNILPFGVDPHSFELTPNIMSKIEHSNLVFYSGAGLEPWVDRIKFKSKVIDMSQSVKLRKLNLGELESHEHHEHHNALCSHNTLDPHYWLDIDNMKSATKVVVKELIILQPQNKEQFLENSNKYFVMLDKLNNDYLKSLSNCKVNHLILNHNSIGYLAQKYAFHSESLSGLSPEAEPTPNDIKRIINEINENAITTIFFENFVSSKVIKTIAKDTGINVEVIESLGNITADEAKEKATYKELMYKNLNKLSKALVCN